MSRQRKWRVARAWTLRPVVGVLVAGASIASTAACSGQYQLVQDDRLHFVAPSNHSRVGRPVTIEWTMDRFNLIAPDGSHSKSAGLFAVFVDRASVRPGQSLNKIIKKDAACLDKGPTCLNPQALADHDVYLTEKTRLTIVQLPSVASTGSIENHTVTVILVDGSGRRIGESAWDLSFKVKKRTF